MESSELHFQKVIQELVDGSTRKTVRDELDLVVLPRQLWCCLKGIAGGETCCEVGWLFDQGRAITSKCIFSDNGKLKASSSLFVSPKKETFLLLIYSQSVFKLLLLSYHRYTFLNFVSKSKSNKQIETKKVSTTQFLNGSQFHSTCLL